MLCQSNRTHKDHRDEKGKQKIWMTPNNGSLNEIMDNSPKQIRVNNNKIFEFRL